MHVLLPHDTLTIFPPSFTALAQCFQICEGCLLLKDHRSKVVRSSLIHLLPRLSEYCPEAFVRSYLDDSIDILMRCMKTPELRGVALLAIGRLCRTMGSHLSYRVDELVAIVREALVGGGGSTSGKKGREIPPEALKCVSDMVCGLGVSFHYRVLGLLDAMLQAGLTEELIEALAVIASNMPMHKEVVHQRLLTEIVKVLGVTLDSRDKKAAAAVATPQKSRLWPFRRAASDSNMSPGGKESLNMSQRGNKAKAGFRQRRKGFAPVATAAGGGDVEGGSGGSNLSLAPMFSSSISNSEVPWKGASSSSLTIDQYIAKPTNYNADMVLLAMRTLRMLSTPSSGLLMLLHRYVLPFLHAKEEVVREEAASTAAKLVSPTAHSCGNRGPTANAVEMVLSKLLEVTITDNSQHVRMRVLKGVDKYFDRHLCQMHHISTLMYLTSDESFDIRYAAVELLGKLADKNPAVVLPNMRQVFKHLLAQLQTGSDVRLKEEAAYTICAFFRSVPLHRVVTPFVNTLIQTIPLEGDVRLVTASMEALGELCTVMRQHMIPHADHLVPIIIMNLLDRSAKKKQEVAARTLGRLVSASGLVVAPYLQYPQLLPKTLELLSKGVASVPWSMRTEILRTLGLIGALDPRKYQHLLGHISDSSVGKDPNDFTISKISRQGVGEWYLGEGTVRKFSEDAMRTQHMTSVITVKRWQRDRAGSMSVKDGEANDSVFSRHTDVLVRAAIQINGVEADGPAADMMYELTVMRAQSYPAGLEQPRLIPGSENYYPRVALTCLMNILQDTTLNMHHSAVTQSILYIFKFLEMQCVPYLEEIFPFLVQMFKKSSPGFRESLLHQFTKLASIAQYHLAPHLESLFEVVIEFWNDHTHHLLQLVEAVAVHCHENIRPFIPQLLNKLMASLTIPRDMVAPRAISGTNLADMSSKGGVFPAATDELSYMVTLTLKSVLKCICTMRGHITPYLDLIIPALCKFISQLQELSSFPEKIFGLTAHTMYLLSLKSALLDSPQVVSRAVHTLAKMMVFVQEKGAGKPGNAIFSYAIKFFCMAAAQLNKQFLVFDHTLRETFAICGVECKEYINVIVDIRMGKMVITNRFLDDLQADLDLTAFSTSKELKDQTLLPGLGIELISDMVAEPRDSFMFIADAAMYRGSGHGGGAKSSAKHSTNPATLQKAWDVSQRSTVSDWNAWFGRFSVQLLMESPSPALRACAELAQAYIPLARELFQAAFVSCWMELNEQYQEHLVRSLHIAFRSSTIPQEILLVLLNLAEFMEHDVNALPIDPRLLAELAERNHAYAKALHYRELEFRATPSSCFDSLININKKLSLYDSAFGVLRMVQKMQDAQTGFGITVQESWLANLGQWQEALDMYEKNLAADPTDSDSILGKVKCLNAVGKWEDALGLLSPNLDLIESAGTTVAMKASVIGEIHVMTHNTYFVNVVRYHAMRCNIMCCLWKGARAAWSLNRWDVMDSFVQRLPANNMDSTFMKAVLAVHAEDYDTSSVYIDRTRKHLDETVSAEACV
jgi:tetratricopeptide (TPR) repeat protein